ncbi:DBD_Tnp_Mut domain-containing protein [Raphanus sativus]|nr:DBD_Tnp_Mut domain-containing protein [Raphanus sativus]
MKGYGEYGAPPLEIRNNNNVELFMAVRLDCIWLELYVTYGSVDVDLYRKQRAEEDAGDLRGGLDRPPRPVPWRGLCAKGYLIANEDVLMDVCTREEFDLIKHASEA